MECYSDLEPLINEFGDNILIGFDGGENAINEKDYGYLVDNRRYKYLESTKMLSKTKSQWIPGNKFRDLIEKHPGKMT